MYLKNIIKILIAKFLLVLFLLFFTISCSKYCRNLMISSSDENHVSLVMSGGHNKCFLETDITPKANNHCNIFGKKALYKGQRRIHSQLLYIDYHCVGKPKLNKKTNKNLRNIYPKDIPENYQNKDLIIIQPSEVL